MHRQTASSATAAPDEQAGDHAQPRSDSRPASGASTLSGTNSASTTTPALGAGAALLQLQPEYEDEPQRREVHRRGYRVGGRDLNATEELE